ncbi:MAG: DUF1015 domain-containing protein [Propionibacteriaceae bacterium]|jgi:uncharacterized protein (DUF1015 family)|nr:DUF1015 domain-containing protein [Propionibacteriaceae bacterium]
MPVFRPFPALRYSSDLDLNLVLAPPYDVLSEDDVHELHESHPHNITHVDVPENQDYSYAATKLWDWIEEGILTADKDYTFSIYRMAFTDPTGTPREIVGVLGGLEVVDDPLAPTDESTEDRGTTVLPHERTTPKASTDRLELMHATATNSSPVWGLSLATGLTAELHEPGEVLGSVVVDGATHTVERISDPDRIARIREIIESDDVLIADGHHRYGVSRIYRDEVRNKTGRHNTRAERTLTFINELIEDQLSIQAIHRLYSGASPEALRSGLETCFDLSPVTVTTTILAEMVDLGRLVLLWPDGSAEWLTPKPGAFDHVRSLDGLWLETALEGVQVDVTYQHGLDEMRDCVATGTFTAGVLIRPTSIEEIRRTAREGLLMPPKSTFFTPKLLTGWVLRATEPLKD